MKRILTLAFLLLTTPIFADTVFPFGTQLKVLADFDGLDAEGHPTSLISARCRIPGLLLIGADITPTGIICTLPNLDPGNYSIVVEFGNIEGVSASPDLFFTILPPDSPPPSQIPPGSCTISPDGTEGDTITDSSCTIWTLLGDNGLSSTGKKISYIYKGTLYVGQGETLVYSGGVIFTLNGTQWMKFNVDHWDNVDSPIVTIPPSPTPTTISISGSIIINGVAHPFSVVVP